MTNKFFLILSAILILGCTTNDRTSDDIANKDTININIGNEPPTLDWSLAMDSTS